MYGIPICNTTKQKKINLSFVWDGHSHWCADNHWISGWTVFFYPLTFWETELTESSPNEFWLSWNPVSTVKSNGHIYLCCTPLCRMGWNFVGYKHYKSGEENVLLYTQHLIDYPPFFKKYCLDDPTSNQSMSRGAGQLPVLKAGGQSPPAFLVAILTSQEVGLILCLVLAFHPLFHAP